MLLGIYPSVILTILEGEQILNVLYTEIVAIITRSSIISFWLTGLVTNGVMNNSIGMVKNFWIKYFIIVIISIFFSLFVNGKINIYKISNESNSIISDKFYLDSLSIIFLILKGNKINNIRRNIVFFPGSKESKNITITNDGLILCIENTYPPKTKDITVTFIILIFTLICLFCAPGISLLIFHYTKSILDTYNINVNSSNLLKDFYLIILSYYLLPFVIPNKDAKKSIIRYFSINLGLYNGYQVLTSPLIPYIGNFENNYIGLADPQKRIFVNPNFIRNKTIFQYIVAHEVGHLTDKIYHTLKYILSPILFPYLTFIIFTMKTYY
jgi:hypothetical protein